jgi:geranylgeranyl pyrophosphate synthase
MNEDRGSLVNSLAAYQQMLRERLHFFLSALHPAVYADVVRAFEDELKILHQVDQNLHAPQYIRTSGIWSLLPLLVAQHIAPEIDPVYASSVALAVESFVTALDLLDDIEDEDQTDIVHELGTARVINTATILLTLAQQALLSLSELGISPTTILRLLQTLQESSLVVTTGQHLDIIVENRPAHEFTREECIEIAATKSGALLRLACLMGAQCAGASDELCAKYAEFGELLGIAAQLDNDCNDLYYLLYSQGWALSSEKIVRTSRVIKSDLVRGKKTLPIVLAAAEIAKTQGASMANMQNALQQAATLSDTDKEAYMRAFREGIITAWGICLLYRERASERLQELEAQKPFTPLLHLLVGV